MNNSSNTPYEYRKTYSAHHCFTYYTRCIYIYIWVLTWLVISGVLLDGPVLFLLSIVARLYHVWSTNKGMNIASSQNKQFSLDIHDRNFVKNTDMSFLLKCLAWE